MAIDGINGNTNYIYPTQYEKIEKRQPVAGNNDDNEEPKQLLGSAKTEIVKKTSKSVWKTLKNFVKKLLKGDKEAREQAADIYNIYDNTHKVVQTINDLSDTNNNDLNNNNYIA